MRLRTRLKKINLVVRAKTEVDMAENRYQLQLRVIWAYQNSKGKKTIVDCLTRNASTERKLWNETTINVIPAGSYGAKRMKSKLVTNLA